MTISNDGATIMKLLDVVHPAAKTLVDVSLSQDAEVCCAQSSSRKCAVCSSRQTSASSVVKGMGFGQEATVSFVTLLMRAARVLGCVPVQVGDGTTTVVILSGELLRAAKPFVEEGVHPRVRAGAAASGSVLVYASMRYHTAGCNPRPLHTPHEAVASRCTGTAVTPASPVLP